MRNDTAFSLVECMIAIVLASFLVLGAVAMTTTQIRGDTQAYDMTTAEHMAQAKINDWVFQPWDALGTIEDLPENDVDAERFGLTSSWMFQETQRVGRYPKDFTLTFVVCVGSSGMYTSGPNTDPCLTNPFSENTRTKWLSCDASDFATAPGVHNREKKIKVQVSWFDQSGNCHFTHMEMTNIKS